MNAHIAKPIDPDKLYQTLLGLMGTSQGAAAFSSIGDGENAPSSDGVIVTYGEAHEKMDPDLLAKAGVDYNMGTRRFGGKSEIYEKYLLKFFDKNPFIALKGQMESGDCEAAFLTAHDLKGATGNLCLDKVFEKVSQLTELLRDGELSDSATALLNEAMEYYGEAEKAVKGSEE